MMCIYVIGIIKINSISVLVRICCSFSLPLPLNQLVNKYDTHIKEQKPNFNPKFDNQLYFE